MNSSLTFSSREITPEPSPVYEHQGIPATAQIPAHVEALYARALDRFADTAEPRGVFASIDRDAFVGVYEGEGRNEAPTPVGDIAPRAAHLALFAVTLGPRISAEIEKSFEANDLAEACMLDSVASIAADRAADILQERYENDLTDAMGASRDKRLRANGMLRVLRYSPGYCGWHISGQRRLFDYLRPERIGLSLRASFLMDPLKSVSGVLIAGPRDLHDVPDTFDFCSQCETHGCRERIRAL